jgi:hypothetical protein
MRIEAIVVTALAVALLSGCHGGSSSTDGALTLCPHPASLDDGGPGACTIGRASLTCTLPSGVGCGCVSDGTSCDDCGPGSGATCQNQCNDNEYAAACGGPPRPDASTSYASPPPGCRSIAPTPAGVVFYCCPCL